MRLYPGLPLRKLAELAILCDFRVWHVIRHIGPSGVRAGKVRGHRIGTQSIIESPGLLEERISRK